MLTSQSTLNVGCNVCSRLFSSYAYIHVLLHTRKILVFSALSLKFVKMLMSRIRRHANTNTKHQTHGFAEGGQGF